MILRSSNRDSGSLTVIGLVEGLRADKSSLTVLAQSIYSVESWVAQKFRSSSSVLKLGIGLRALLRSNKLVLFLFIYLPFLFVLISGRDDPDLLISDGKAHK